MTRAIRVDEMPDDPSPGMFEFVVRHSAPETITGMLFACPCGCGDVSSIDFSNVPPKGSDTERWEWDGDLDSPTLSPSLHKQGGCGWHGWLRNGEFVSC